MNRRSDSVEVKRGAVAWVVTLAATAVSAYALDVLATAAGIFLVATEILSGLDHPLLLAALGLSYVVWGLGLTANLRQNHALLSQTGTSTNIFSKAAFDFATARSASARVRRLAGAAGYVVTELAKEVPYYAGAFGATVLTDSVTSSEALIFLIGANLGAAAYEQGLAGLTRLLLARRKRARSAPIAAKIPEVHDSLHL